MTHSVNTELPEMAAEDQIQVSNDGGTVWVHSLTDGSTVGRFSKQFGIDVHRTMTDQMAGGEQCLSCSHEPAGPEAWRHFVELMKKHHEVTIPWDLISFPSLAPRL